VPFTRRLGSEEWFENMTLHLRRHSSSGIGDRQHDVRSRLDFKMRNGVGFGQIQRSRLDEQTSSLRHGIAGVHHEVDNNLIDLSGVCQDLADVFSQSQFKLDVLAD
jgi:hypothetical protein